MKIATTDEYSDLQSFFHLQFVLVENRVSSIRRLELFEDRWRRIGFCFLRLLSDLHGGLWTMMEFPVQFATVKIKHELPKLSWCGHIICVREQIHVPERVDCNQR